MWHGRSSLLFKKKWKKTTMSFMQMIKWLSGDLISSRLLLSLPHIDWQIGLPVQRKGYTQLLSATLNHVIYTLWWSHSFTLFSINMPCIQNLHAVWLLCCSADEKKKNPTETLLSLFVRQWKQCIVRSFTLLQYICPILPVWWLMHFFTTRYR